MFGPNAVILLEKLFVESAVDSFFKSGQPLTSTSVMDEGVLRKMGRGFRRHILRHKVPSVKQQQEIEQAMLRLPVFFDRTGNSITLPSSGLIDINDPSFEQVNSKYWDKGQQVGKEIKDAVKAGEASSIQINAMLSSPRTFDRFVRMGPNDWFQSIPSIKEITDSVSALLSKNGALYLGGNKSKDAKKLREKVTKALIQQLLTVFKKAIENSYYGSEATQADSAAQAADSSAEEGNGGEAEDNVIRQGTAQAAELLSELDKTNIPADTVAGLEAELAHAESLSKIYKGHAEAIAGATTTGDVKDHSDKANVVKQQLKNSLGRLKKEATALQKSYGDHEKNLTTVGKFVGGYNNLLNAYTDTQRDIEGTLSAKGYARPDTDGGQAEETTQTNQADQAVKPNLPYEAVEEFTTAKGVLSTLYSNMSSVIRNNLKGAARKDNATAVADYNERKKAFDAEVQNVRDTLRYYDPKGYNESGRNEIAQTTEVINRWIELANKLNSTVKAFVDSGYKKQESITESFLREAIFNELSSPDLEPIGEDPTKPDADTDLAQEPEPPMPDGADAGLPPDMGADAGLPPDMGGMPTATTEDPQATAGVSVAAPEPKKDSADFSKRAVTKAVKAAVSDELDDLKHSLKNALSWPKVAAKRAIDITTNRSKTDILKRVKNNLKTDMDEQYKSILNDCAILEARTAKAKLASKKKADVKKSKKSSDKKKTDKKKTKKNESLFASLLPLAKFDEAQKNKKKDKLDKKKKTDQFLFGGGKKG